MGSNEQLQEILRQMGCITPLKPYREAESGAILLHVRRPAEIIDGRLVGSEIDLYDSATFRVWTPRIKKAKACAARYGLRIRILDGECELFIPIHLSVTLLHVFGAKVKSKRKSSPQAIAALRQYHANKRLARLNP